MDMQPMSEKTINALCWTARIWGLLILVITVLVLVSHIIFPDTEPGTYPPVENLIPVSIFISVLGLAIAWKWKLAGALINLGFFSLNLLIYWLIQGKFLPLPVILVLSPIYIPGILFLVCWFLTRSPQDNESIQDS